MSIFLFDFETTGLSASFHEPVQVAAVLLDNELNEVAHFESLIRPLWPERADPRALAVHGIPMSRMMGAPHPESVFSHLSRFAASSGKVLPAGHNVSFDLRFLAAAEATFGFVIDRHPQALDTVPLIRRHLQKRGLTPNARLTTATAYYRIAHQAHDALGDVRATAEVLRRIRAEAPHLVAISPN